MDIPSTDHVPGEFKQETIGRCELCGLIDHHLIDGECPACRRSPIAAAMRLPRAFAACSARINGRVKASRPLGADLIVHVDSADNQVIRLRPMGGAA
ncbi:MAG: hypothetical protein COS35_07435 [Zetaproteobacteria bacterium CG02_land_8_20_14_3_00_50_9]|nr:MAG: hypothetical protein AUJ57_12125 [Zetaproteobacteria bacterium CG1_02_53_45]PIQ33370.1 MAG: hypothetical protein COW62_05485 [Zetaproteobacteria bacterium CG17_big_fil_post_rev_8_21_14_2_50_50_13]PIV30301.1 MAG: hypothetical protein COS35_07435 [Zetaproteobacteria bacterium CG02_land_8_20_14_3_00_50_9]PIY57008.1 MAG: hypothetical protein COZ00_01150 [Zetaproteobacteria bacterium CG_4_10_14_0_8_um_filter_49_80]